MGRQCTDAARWRGGRGDTRPAVEFPDIAMSHSGRYDPDACCGETYARARAVWLRDRSGIVRRYRYVFIVTYGRSGSTLLMGLLNTIPGYRIRGENLNVLYRLYHVDATLRQAHNQHVGDDNGSPTNPWYGASSWQLDAFRGALLDGFVAHVLRPSAGSRVLGFKEIRYTDGDMKDLTEYLDFLRSAFPDSKIVFNHRLLTDVARSGWWADYPEALERIKAADDRFLAVPADARHFHFYFDEIDESLDNIRALFRFLGDEFNEARVRRTLATRHSYSLHSTKAPPQIRRSSAPRARVLAKRVLSAARLR